MAEDVFRNECAGLARQGAVEGCFHHGLNHCALHDRVRRVRNDLGLRDGIGYGAVQYEIRDISEATVRQRGFAPICPARGAKGDKRGCDPPLLKGTRLIGTASVLRHSTRLFLLCAQHVLRGSGRGRARPVGFELCQVQIHAQSLQRPVPGGQRLPEILLRLSGCRFEGGKLICQRRDGLRCCRIRFTGRAWRVAQFLHLSLQCRNLCLQIRIGGCRFRCHQDDFGLRRDGWHERFDGAKPIPLVLELVGCCRGQALFLLDAGKKIEGHADGKDEGGDQQRQQGSATPSGRTPMGCAALERGQTFFEIGSRAVTHEPVPGEGVPSMQTLSSPSRKTHCGLTPATRMTPFPAVPEFTVRSRPCA